MKNNQLSESAKTYISMMRAKYGMTAREAEQVEIVLNVKVDRRAYELLEDLTATYGEDLGHIVSLLIAKEHKSLYC